MNCEKILFSYPTWIKASKHQHFSPLPNKKGPIRTLCNNTYFNVLILLSLEKLASFMKKRFCPIKRKITGISLCDDCYLLRNKSFFFWQVIQSTSSPIPAYPFLSGILFFCSDIPPIF